MVSCTDSDIVFVVQDGGHFNGLETSDAKGYHTGLVLKSAGSTIKFYTVDLPRLFDEVGGPWRAHASSGLMEGSHFSAASKPAMATVSLLPASILPGRDVGIARSSDLVPVPPASVTCSLAEFLMRKPAIPKGP